MKRVIIVGSPRSNGRSAHLAEMLFEANIDERPEDELYLVPVSEVEIGPCIGCNACRKPAEVVFKSDSGEEVAELRQRCVFDDDMQTLYDLLDEADELTVVSPIYFSGAPAPMKCVFDRMQPYFWVTQVKGREQASEGVSGDKNALDVAYIRHLRTKRPATLHVIGEGGDPHGFEPLVSEAKSALACAGFRLESVFDWVGKINADGEIVAEAAEIQVEWPESKGQPARQAASSGQQEQPKQRPKLDLSAGQKKRQPESGAKRAKGQPKGKGKRRG